ncbi:MAG: hypothetical protein L6R40_008448 [Gallowayella cf. fulva]|nr:MAG: hypothetical protein L6R40_008448 [Xanthomendoza cf. fulva]
MHHIRPQVLGGGSVAIAYKITEIIAVKQAKILDENKQVQNEHQIYDLLGKHCRCPNIVQSSYRIPSAIFLHLMSGAELTNAVASLESLGLAHGDLRPPNLLLDGEDHLKVSDFDNTTAIGEVFDGTQPPYARVLGNEGAKNRAHSGTTGRVRSYSRSDLIAHSGVSLTKLGA